MTQASKLNLVDSLDFTPEVSSREMSLFDRLAVEFRLIEIKTKARHERGKKMLLSILRLKRQQKENIKKSDLSQINDYMKTLSMLLSSYEAVSFAVGNTAPNEMLKYLMELNKVTQVDPQNISCQETQVQRVVFTYMIKVMQKSAILFHISRPNIRANQ